jgi:hypothetical protein
MQDGAADNEMPGSMPSSPVSAIPDWYRVGWRQNSGIDEIQEGQEKTRTLLATFVDEQYYGDWYHNAAVIVFVRFYPIIQNTYNYPVPKYISFFNYRLFLHPIS